MSRVREDDMEAEMQNSSCSSCEELTDMPQPESPRHSHAAPDPPHSSNCCPICLDFISDQAFLDPCFHKFCFPCILQWSEMIAAYPSSDGNQSLDCPLCKTPATCIIHNVVLETFQRYPLLGSQATEKPFFLTQSHYQRLAFYKKNLRCELPEENKYRRRGIRVAGNSSLKCWMQRELQALMQVEDVDIVAQHIIGVLEYFEEKRKGQFEAAVTWKDAVLDAARPFVYEHSEKFCEELQSFLLSGLSVAAYDQLGEQIVTVSTF